jgi:hypothetical protein
MRKPRQPELYKKLLGYKMDFTPEPDRKSRHYDIVKEFSRTPVICTVDHVREINWETLPNRFVLKADIGTG